jgi:hypothetical protein
MKKTEISLAMAAAGVLIAGAADLVIHHEKIRQSLHGQEQHYATRHRGPLTRLAHALAAQTFTGRLVMEARQRLSG